MDELLEFFCFFVGGFWPFFYNWQQFFTHFSQKRTGSLGLHMSAFETIREKRWKLLLRSFEILALPTCWKCEPRPSLNTRRLAAARAKAWEFLTHQRNGEHFCGCGFLGCLLLPQRNMVEMIEDSFATDLRAVCWTAGRGFLHEQATLGGI